MRQSPSNFGRPNFGKSDFGKSNFQASPILPDLASLFKPIGTLFVLITARMRPFHKMLSLASSSASGAFQAPLCRRAPQQIALG